MVQGVESRERGKGKGEYICSFIYLHRCTCIYI